MCKHRQLIIGLLLGTFIGSVAVGMATPDVAMEFEKRSDAIHKAYFGYFGMTSSLTQINSAKAELEQLELLSDQLNHIIRQNEALLLEIRKGQE